MQKLIFIISAVCLLMVINACDKANSPSDSTTTEVNSTSEESVNDSAEVGKALVEKWGKEMTLTEEQKAKIIELAQAAGIMTQKVRTSDDRAKLNALRKQIIEEVLTPEQQSEITWDPNSTSGT